MTTDADFAVFNPAVKAMLHRLGPSDDYSRTEDGAIKTRLGPKESEFIAGRDSFYVAAIGEDRWPYTQRHRGPKGFLRVLDTTILGFASIASSRRYLSPGNALLFLIDHALPARLKIWADAEVSEDPAIIEKLAKTRGRSPATHLAFLFHVRAFGWNDEKHNVHLSAREQGGTQRVRTSKANPIQRRRWIEQKQTWLDPICIERGISNPNWTQCDATSSRAGTGFTSVFGLKSLPYT